MNDYESTRKIFRQGQPKSTLSFPIKVEKLDKGKVFFKTTINALKMSFSYYYYKLYLKKNVAR